MLATLTAFGVRPFSDLHGGSFGVGDSQSTLQVLTDVKAFRPHWTRPGSVRKLTSSLVVRELLRPLVNLGPYVIGVLCTSLQRHLVSGLVSLTQC